MFLRTYRVIFGVFSLRVKKVLRKLKNHLFKVPIIDMIYYRKMDKHVRIGTFLFIHFLGTHINKKENILGIVKPIGTYS